MEAGQCSVCCELFVFGDHIVIARRDILTSMTLSIRCGTTRWPRQRGPVPVGIGREYPGPGNLPRGELFSVAKAEPAETLKHCQDRGGDSSWIRRLAGHETLNEKPDPQQIGGRP